MQKNIWLALGMLLLANTAQSAPVFAEATNTQAVRASAQTPGLETAEALLKVLTRRGLQLQDRAKVAPKPAAPDNPFDKMALVHTELNGSHPQPLNSRMSGPAAHHLKYTFPAASSLADYLVILSRTSSGACVCGRFSDWRTVSKYRRVAGLHYGYDVALKAGSLVVAGWPGRVTSIANWIGKEYGITINSPDGFNTTYGHLFPVVRSGMWVEPGDVIGMIVHDHVDIKMRDSQGKFIDFALGVPLVQSGGMSSAAVTLNDLQPSIQVEPLAEAQALPGPDWTLKPEAVKVAITYVRLRHQEASLVAAGGDTPASELQEVRKQLAACRSQLLMYGVPEELLLAAFLEAPSFRSGNFGMGDAAETATNSADRLGEWLRRQQMTRDARYSIPQLKSVLKDLSE